VSGKILIVFACLKRLGTDAQWKNFSACMVFFVTVLCFVLVLLFRNHLA